MKKNRKRAFSTIEYAATVAILIAALIAMKKPISRVMMGRWKILGDSFAHGSQHDVNLTLECGKYVPFDKVNKQWGDPVWYEQACYGCCMDKYTSDCTSVGLVATEIQECRAKEDVIEKRDCCANKCKDSGCE